MHKRDIAPTGRQTGDLYKHGKLLFFFKGEPKTCALHFFFFPGVAVSIVKSL